MKQNQYDILVWNIMYSGSFISGKCLIKHPHIKNFVSNKMKPFCLPKHLVVVELKLCSQIKVGKFLTWDVLSGYSVMSLKSLLVAMYFYCYNWDFLLSVISQLLTNSMWCSALSVWPQLHYVSLLASGDSGESIVVMLFYHWPKTPMMPIISNRINESSVHNNFKFRKKLEKHGWSYVVQTT